MSAHSVFIDPEVSIGMTISIALPRVSSHTTTTVSSSPTEIAGWPAWEMMGVTSVWPIIVMNPEEVSNATMV